MGSHELKSKSIGQLKGRWGVAIGTVFIAELLPTLFVMVSLIIASLSPSVGVYSFLIIICFLLAIVLDSVLSVGKIKFFLNMTVDKETAMFSDLFSQLDLYLKATGITLLTGIITFIGTLLFIIPGIIFAYMYAQSLYVLVENPEKSVAECMYESRQIMKGHKFDLFCVQLSFIGWAILTAFTLYIGLLWLCPYMELTFANFYLSLKKQPVA